MDGPFGSKVAGPEVAVNWSGWAAGERPKCHEEVRGLVRVNRDAFWLRYG